MQDIGPAAGDGERCAASGVMGWARRGREGGAGQGGEMVGDLLLLE